MLDYIIIILLVLILLLLLFLLFKKNNQNDNDLIERLGKFETSINKEIGSFKYDLSKDVHKDFEELKNMVEQKLYQIGNTVNERLDKNFEKTNQTFNNVLERLSKIDEAQKKIEGLNSEIVSLQNVLTDKKTRGTFGEVTLEYILNNAFGTNNDGIYLSQYKLSNGAICDIYLKAPEPLGNICIDSKFPLENYRKMTDRTKDKSVRELYEKEFKADVKKHINDISTKYIIKGETSNEAIMFIPAEAIFAELNAYHLDLLDYAYAKKVWICGPTTLMSTLSIISIILKDMERDKYTKLIHEELGKLSTEFDRFKDRWSKLSKDIDNVSQDVKNLNTTSEKITNRFNQINQVEIKDQKEVTE